MSDVTAFTTLLQRWQQQDDDELLLETEWIASQIAQAVERAAKVAMAARMQELDVMKGVQP